MENIDIKDFQSVSAVSELDNILLVQSSGTAGKMTVALFRAAVRDDITPHISGNTWWVGTVDTGVAAAGQTPSSARETRALNGSTRPIRHGSCWSIMDPSR